MTKYIFLLCILLCTGCEDNDDDFSISSEILSPIPELCNYSIDDFATVASNIDSTISFAFCPSPNTFYVNVEQYDYSYPCFNPNNANEIAYMRKDNNTATGCNFEIWTFDFCKGEKRFITDGICYSIDWSVKDWIVFTGQDRQLWKIKSNGDSLTQLTNSSIFNNYAIWNSEGTKLIYSNIGLNITSSFFLTIDETGEVVDTIPEMLYNSSWHWSSNNEVISCSKRNAMDESVLAFYNINNQEFTEMPALDPIQYGYIIDTDWLNKDISIWSTIWLIGITDITTNESKEIAEGAQNRYYHNLTASSDGKFIVTEREDLSQIDECHVGVRRNLYIMNADGTNERKISIPE